MFFFATTGKDNILLTHLNLLYAIANTVCAGGAGRANGIINALNLRTGRQASHYAVRHGFGHHIRSYALDAFFAERIGRLQHAFSRCATRTHNHAGTDIRNHFTR